MNSAAKPDKQFEPFLHAVIHEDGQGPALTVLSALARRDLDPWEEAASLAGLAPEAAIVKLIALLRAMPPGQRSPDAALPARLQALLPRARTVRADVRPMSAKTPWHPSRQLPTGPAAVEAAPRANFNYLLVYLVFVAILVGSEWLNASGESLPAASAEQPKPADAAQARAAQPPKAPPGSAALSP